MLLILSSDSDSSTNDVIKWMINKGISFTRVNGVDTICFCHIDFNQNGGVYLDFEDQNGRSIKLSKYTSFWYRRGGFFFAKPKINNFKKQVGDILEREWKTVTDFVYNYLETKHSLGSSVKESNHNKLISMTIAASTGLKLPPTLITSDLNLLKSFNTEKEDIISKGINNIFAIKHEGSFTGVGTKKITKDKIDSLESMFYPTLYQKNIIKAFELRVFFIRDSFFAMAIFSQLNEESKVDSRVDNINSPIRCTPFLLPDYLRLKLMEFIKKSNLDTGSIDLIKSNDGKYYFLEINTVGQFGMVSHPCNYYLEKKIAKKLIEYAEE